jgi:hypothetical protein
VIFNAVSGKIVVFLFVAACSLAATLIVSEYNAASTFGVEVRRVMKPTGYIGEGEG